MRQISVKVIKMLKREYIIKKIKSLPEDSLKEITDLIEFLEVKRKKNFPFKAKTDFRKNMKTIIELYQSVR